MSAEKLLSMSRSEFREYVLTSARQQDFIDLYDHCLNLAPQKYERRLDSFAGQAMQGILAHDSSISYEECAYLALGHAKALINVIEEDREAEEHERS